MIFLAFEWIDQQNEEQEKEFDTLARAQEWLKGQRETDFNWICMYNASGYELAESYSEILGF